MPKEKFSEKLPVVQQCQFNMEDLIPQEGVVADEEALAKKAEKMGLKLQPSKDSKNKSVLHQNEISMFMTLHKVLLKRYMVLTPKALVVYKERKNDGAFNFSSLSKPWMIIPLSEILDVEIYQAGDKKKDIELNDSKSESDKKEDEKSKAMVSQQPKIFTI